MAKKTKRAGVTVSTVSEQGIADSVLAEKEWRVTFPAPRASAYTTLAPQFPTLISALHSAETKPKGYPGAIQKGYAAYGQTVAELKGIIADGRDLPEGPGFLNKKPSK